MSSPVPTSQPELQIAAGLVRRDADLLMVRQAGSGEEPFWSIPAGRVEPGERVADALRRELLEETGITVIDPGRLAFTVHVDDQCDHWSGTVWTWDVASWEGTLDSRDPDRLVIEAAWLPIDEAVGHLRRISWQPLTARYLLGELEPGSEWTRRVDQEGREDVTPA